MTDKQIMIDVTKCIHFDKSDIPNGCTCYWDGECNHYCYYKKYMYKEQECEKLRFPMKDNNYAILTKEEFENFNQLKKENEQLKQTLAEIKEIAESEMDSKEVMAVQYMLNGSVDNKNKVLQQILQKINECEVDK